MEFSVSERVKLVRHDELGSVGLLGVALVAALPHLLEGGLLPGRGAVAPSTLRSTVVASGRQ